ncbi:MAG: aminotransferase [Thermoprotei archaeon]
MNTKVILAINMKKILPMIFLIMLIAVYTFSIATPVKSVKYVVAVDLAHGESTKYLKYIQGNITWVEWVNITTPITTDTLRNIDMLIIGQATQPLTPDELNALKTWVNSGSKVLWVAGDSDYGPGVTYQDIANLILSSVGSVLRVDLCSVEDPVQNAKASYRVIGNVTPDSGAEAVAGGIKNGVLYHGPGILAYTLPNGTWAPLEKSRPDNVYRIVWTSPNGKIVENNPPAAKAHKAGDSGKFVLLAAEVMKIGNKQSVIIASGESPYGDYEPTWAWVYYGILLDGPRFVTNMINWSLALATTVVTTITQTTTVTSTFTTTVTNTVTSTSTTTATTTVTSTAVSTTTVESMTGWGVAGVFIVIAIVAIALLFRKR